MRSRARRWLALLALSMIAYHMLAPAGLPRLGVELSSIWTHFAGFGALSAIMALAFYRNLGFWRLGAILIITAAVLEIAQIWSPGRLANITDFAASAAGIVAGLILSWVALKSFAWVWRSWLDRDAWRSG
jgi:VanZ family protein